MTFALSTDEVREAYILAADTSNADRDNGEDFDHWLSAHDTEVRASVVPEEPEWEYRCSFRTGDPFTATVADPTEHAKTCSGLIERRRPASVWLPVEGGK